MLDTAAEKAELRYQHDQERSGPNSPRRSASWAGIAPRNARGDGLRVAKPVNSDEQALRVYQRNERIHQAKTAQFEAEHAANIAGLRSESEADANNFTVTFAAKQAKVEENFKAQWLALENGLEENRRAALRANQRR